MTALASPFSVFHVLPCYGRREAVITWELQPGLTGGVYFYRSNTGSGTWTLLNPGAPVAAAGGEFLDLTVAAAELFEIPHYRGVLDPAGGPAATWLKGPSVSALDRLTRREYFLTRAVIRREYRGMSGPKGNGIRAFHLVPRADGEPARHYDPETGQLLGPDCPADPAEGYGTPWQGGFHAPLQTWVHLFQVAGERQEERPDLTGEQRAAEVQLRLLAFPKPAEGHLVVLPESDRRYALVAPIEPFLLRGAVPLFWECKATLLERTDPRARLRLPGLQADPTWLV